MTESLESGVTEALQLEKGETSSADLDNDSTSASSTETDNSDSDDIDSSATPKDPELLLIKATSLKEEGNTYFKSKDYENASRYVTLMASSLNIVTDHGS